MVALTVNIGRIARTCWVLAMAAMLLCLGTGCGKRDTGKTVIRLTAWSNDIEEKHLRESLAEFEKLHPNIKVELDITNWSRISWKVMVSTAGGRPPDVTRVSSEWYVPLAAKGLLEPLDPYVKRDNFDIDDYYPEAIEGWGKYKGTLYTLPGDVDVGALYYNKTMFDRCGVPYPDWTWDYNRYVDAAKKLTRDTDNDGRLDQWGASIGNWQNFVYENGGEVVSPDMGTCLLDQPAAIAGLQRMADLVNKFHVAPVQEEVANTGNARLFVTGRIGMITAGSYAAKLDFEKYVNSKVFTYDVAPIPRGPNARVTFIGGTGWAMLSRSQHKNEAWELVQWLAGPEYLTSCAILNSQAPTRRSVAESKAFLYNPGPPKAKRVFLQMIKFGRTTPHVSCSVEMNQIIGSEFDLVMLGKRSAKDACMRVKPIIDQLLRHME